MVQASNQSHVAIMLAAKNALDRSNREVLRWSSRIFDVERIQARHKNGSAAWYEQERTIMEYQAARVDELRAHDVLSEGIKWLEGVIQMESNEDDNTGAVIDAF